jgi:hypothetical protein
MRSKKGSLNLSINAVVILILALVLLAVGIGFIRSTFGGLIENVQDIGAEISNQRLEELRSSSQEVTFLQERVTIKKTKARIPFSVHNNENTVNTFNLAFSCDDALGAAGRKDEIKKYVTDNFESVASVDLGSGETRLLDFDIELPSDAPSGILLYCSLAVTNGNSAYATPRFEIEYKKE